MPKKIGAFSADDRVMHAVYGLGTVSHVDKQHTTIVFDEVGSRKFLTGIVQLEHSSTAAPTKRSGSKTPKAKK